MKNLVNWFNLKELILGYPVISAFSLAWMFLAFVLMDPVLMFQDIYLRIFYLACAAIAWFFINLSKELL